MLVVGLEVLGVEGGVTPHDGSLRGAEGRGKVGASGARPGRGAPLSEDLSLRCNNGRDNDTGGGISAAHLPLHLLLSPLKSARRTAS